MDKKTSEKAKVLFEDFLYIFQGVFGFLLFVLFSFYIVVPMVDSIGDPLNRNDPLLLLLVKGILYYVVIMCGFPAIMAFYTSKLTVKIIRKFVYNIPMNKYIQSVKSYIDNANLIQKAFLFIGIVAFIFWCSVIDIDALFRRDFEYFIEQLFYRDSRYSGTNPTKVYSVWTMILSVIGSYIFKDNPK